MKQGIIYGGTFFFVFVIVSGLIIYLNSTCENIFQLNFAPRSLVQISDSTKTDSIKTDSLKVVENSEEISQPDSSMIQDSVLLSSFGGVEGNDTIKTNKNDNKNVEKHSENSNPKKENEINDTNNQKTNIAAVQEPIINPEIKNEIQDKVQEKEYTVWVKKITSIYSSMEPRKAAKIIQTYSDNVARDILYNMNKKTAAKVVSEFSPETANRIFRFE